MVKTEKMVLPVEVTLACGHTAIQTKGGRITSPPEVGMQTICWAFRCLTYQEIVKVEPVDEDAQDDTD